MTVEIALALFWVAAGLYALAGLAYMGFLVGAPPLVSRVARVSMLLAFLAHFAEIGARGVAGMHPVSSVSEAIGFLAFLMVGSFLFAQLKKRLDAIGAFVSPAALILLMVAYLSPDRGEASVAGLGVLGRVHIGLAIVGVAIFALATGLAVFYLVQERELKHHKIGRAVKRGAALETLDHLIHRSVQVGFPIFSIAMVTGAVWTAQRAEPMRIEYPIAAIAWAAFAAVLIARHTAGWRGRRAALLTLVGFGAALIVLGIYVARSAGAA
jgi:ABC-type uncharacterized transport system permease subunit